MAILGNSFGEPPLQMEQRVKISGIRKELNKIGESKIPAPYWIKNREGVVLTYVMEPIKVPRMAKKSNVKTYIVGHIDPDNGLLFFLSSMQAIEKGSQIVDVNMTVPCGGGVKYSVFIENYEDYYKRLQKCFNKM